MLGSMKDTFAADLEKKQNEIKTEQTSYTKMKAALNQQLKSQRKSAANNKAALGKAKYYSTEGKEELAKTQAAVEADKEILRNVNMQCQVGGSFQRESLVSGKIGGVSICPGGFLVSVGKLYIGNGRSINKIISASCSIFSTTVPDMRSTLPSTNPDNHSRPPHEDRPRSTIPPLAPPPQPPIIDELVPPVH